jgi:AraC-like DNA-binding protein
MPEIRVLIPTGKTVVTATERAGSRGVWQSQRILSVRAPFIAIVPAHSHVTFSPGIETHGLTIALALRNLKAASRKAFGTARLDVPRWFSACDPFLYELAETLAPLCHQRTPDLSCLDAFADVIALHLVCRYGRRVGVPLHRTALSQRMLETIYCYIQEHLAEPIKVDELATLLHMSASHFARAFKQATGHPPHFYVTNQRLESARAMLAEGTLPLNDVAARAGFQTQQHFTEVFHRYTGVTPRVFRLAAYGTQAAPVNDMPGERKSDTSLQE